MSERDDTADQAGPGEPQRARLLEETLNLPPETARAAAENERAAGMRKPGPADIDAERAAEARATEPREDETPHR